MGAGKPAPFSMSRFNYDPGPPLVGQKVMLATTVYDRTDDGYTFAIASSREALHQRGIKSAYFLLQGNCHVDDARNEVVKEFLASDCTDLVFLDADVVWEPGDLLRLCTRDADVVGGVYPYRHEGREGMPVRLLEGSPEPNDGLVEVEGLPTGFIRIRRPVLEALADRAESYPSPSGDVPLVFERTLEAGTRWGGDLNFCRKWRALGGKVLADYELRLGHAAKTVLYDSLGAWLRRRDGSTLRHVVEKVRAGAETYEDMAEARRFMNNPWTASETLLLTAVKLARRAEDFIIEAGSGLSTVLMAAASKRTVFALEHDPHHANVLRHLAELSGVSNIGLCMCEVKDGWYDLSGKSLPEHFTFGLNDGPPRQIGDRLRFFERLSVDTVLCDDTDDLAYMTALRQLANDTGKRLESVSPRVAILAPDGQFKPRLVNAADPPKTATAGG